MVPNTYTSNWVCMQNCKTFIIPINILIIEKIEQKIILPLKLLRVIYISACSHKSWPLWRLIKCVCWRQIVSKMFWGTLTDWLRSLLLFCELLAGEGMVEWGDWILKKLENLEWWDWSLRGLAAGHCWNIKYLFKILSVFMHHSQFFFIKNLLTEIFL